jgi:hypothetical protein
MTADDSALDEHLSPRRAGQGEHRFPPSFAVLVAAVTYGLLPQRIVVGPRYAIPALEILLLAVLIFTNPVRLERRTRWSRVLSTALAVIVIVTNLATLGLLVSALSDTGTKATELLVAGMQVWVTNVIGFGLLFWELDRGGPFARRLERRDQLPAADWRFSQDENDDAVSEVARGSSKTSGWIPAFVDYFYLSLTNSTAFSPTDTMPLTTRAKMLMSVEGTAALLTSLLVVAKAVGSLSGSGGS